MKKKKKKKKRVILMSSAKSQYLLASGDTNLRNNGLTNIFLSTSLRYEIFPLQCKLFFDNLDFFTFIVTAETNDFSIYKIIPAFFLWL